MSIWVAEFANSSWIFSFHFYFQILDFFVKLLRNRTLKENMLYRTRWIKSLSPGVCAYVRRAKKKNVLWFRRARARFRTIVRKFISLLPVASRETEEPPAVPRSFFLHTLAISCVRLRVYATSRNILECNEKKEKYGRQIPRSRQKVIFEFFCKRSAKNCFKVSAMLFAFYWCVTERMSWNLVLYLI